MKKQLLVGLLIALFGVSIGTAIAPEAWAEPEPHNLGDSGVYAYFPLVPSGFQVFDSILYLTGFGFSAVQLEVDSVAGLLPGAPVQATNIDIRPLEVAALFSASTKGALNFRCEPQPLLCQVFVHRRDRGAGLNFTATLGIFANNSFQFLQPYFFIIP